MKNLDTHQEDGNGNNYFLYISLASPLQTNYKEYFMYDFTAVISSIGGGIGIFLGYSCFGVALTALQNLHRLYERRFTNWELPLKNII